MITKEESDIIQKTFVGLPKFEVTKIFAQTKGETGVQAGDFSKIHVTVELKNHEKAKDACMKTKFEDMINEGVAVERVPHLWIVVTDNLKYVGMKKIPLPDFYAEVEGQITHSETVIIDFRPKKKGQHELEVHAISDSYMATDIQKLQVIKVDAANKAGPKGEGPAISEEQ